MILKSDKLADLLRAGLDGSHTDPLIITPLPNLDKLRESGSVSVDLRLGTWFSSLRRARLTHLAIGEEVAESKLTRSHYVPFGREYVLHPHGFVLGVTLEWLRLPSNLAGYVVGRSSWGRRGLIIATATGVHCGFTGCLTLELTNVGEIPIAISPGMTICQLFLHNVDLVDPNRVDRSQFVGLRKPILGKISPDPFAKRIATAYTTD
jgi:dCTP deaminase